MANNDDILSVSAETDLSKWESEKIIADAGKMDAISDVDISVSTTINDSDISSLTSDLDSLKDDISVSVNVDDSELKTADDVHENLDEDTSTTANVEDQELTDANDILTDIRNIEAINLAINVAGTALEFLQKLDNFTGLPALLEYDDALSTIQGRTGAMIPDAEKLIGDLYTQGWGESRQEIADVIVTADQLGISMDDLEEATTAAFNVAAVTGDDTQTSLRTINNLAKGMGISYTEAADLIVAGTQDGANAAGDLQEALVEFGPKFAEMGISAEGSLAIIQSGLANGAKSASDVADGVKELGTNLGKIDSDEGIASAFETLDKLSDIDLAGLLDAYKTGKVTGDQLYQGIFDGLHQVNQTDPAAAQAIAGSLVGSKAEDFGVGLFGGLSTDFDTAAGDLEGRAAEAGKNMKDNLNTQFLEFQRTVEEFAVDFLSSEQIDLPGKIELIKTGIGDALKVLQEGGTLGEAITVGLKPLGLDDEFAKLESIFGNLVISFLNLVADIQDILGKDSSGTRTELDRLSGQQLAFDLTVDDTDALVENVNQAFQNGLKPESFGAALQGAVTTLVESGEFKKAQDLLDASKGLQLTVDAGSVDTVNANNLTATQASQALIDAARQAATLAATEAQGGVATTTTGAGNRTQILADADSTAAVEEATQAATESVLARNEEAVAIKDVNTALTDTTSTVNDLSVAAGSATDPIDSLVVSTQAVDEAAQSANTSLGLTTIGLEDASTNANSLVTSLNSVNDAILQIMATAQANAGGAGNTTNVNTTINTNSNAEASTAGQQIANQTRGQGG